MTQAHAEASVPDARSPDARSPDARRRSAEILLLLCLATAVTRVAGQVLSPSVAHPDETFQYLEQANRLLGNYGMVPWEYVVGARSWIVPGLLAPLLALGHALSSDPAVALWCVTAAMVALAVATTAAAFALGLRRGGLLAAGFSGLLAACWSELVCLSPHVLADTLSAAPLLGGFAVGYGRAGESRTAMVWAGVLFGLAFILRVQLAPAVAVAMLGIAAPRLRTRIPSLALGFAGPLLLLGLVDWLVLGLPFRSVLTYVRVNSGGVASFFGTMPLSSFAVLEMAIWGPAAPLIALTACLGARRCPLVALCAAIIFVTFSLVPHKEYRFIYSSLLLLMTLCGLGTAEVLSWVGRALRGGEPSRAASAAAAAGLWLVLSGVSAWRPVLNAMWHKQNGWLAAFARVNADPAACGVGVPDDDWFFTGAVRLRRGLGPFAADDAAASAPAYDYLVASVPEIAGRTSVGPFARLGCSGTDATVCLFRREGGCDASKGRLLATNPDGDLRSVLARLGYRLP